MAVAANRARCADASRHGCLPSMVEKVERGPGVLTGGEFRRRGQQIEPAVSFNGMGFWARTRGFGGGDGCGGVR
jgi:hypothetical protein